MLSGHPVSSFNTHERANSLIHYKNFESFNDLFSLESIIELFGFNDNEVFLLKIQELLINETSSLMKDLEVVQLCSRQSNENLFSLFNNLNFFSENDLQSTELFSINKVLIHNIEMGGIEFAENTPSLRLTYPNFYDIIVDYELAVMEDDGSMIDDLSTPDTKLHYPEPFIASPSFVHEDL
jgi:hypothetical protein